MPNNQQRHLAAKYFYLFSLILSTCFPTIAMATTGNNKHFIHLRKDIEFLNHLMITVAIMMSPSTEAALPPFGLFGSCYGRGDWRRRIPACYIAQLTTTFVTIPLTQKSCHFVIFKSFENLRYNKFQVMCFETIAK